MDVISASHPYPVYPANGIVFTFTETDVYADLVFGVGNRLFPG